MTVHRGSILEATKSRMPNIGLECRSLLGTPRTSSTVELLNRQHIRIAMKSIIERRAFRKVPACTLVKEQPNFGCVKVACSPKLQLCPLLAKILQPCCTPVFSVRFDWGNSKPSLVSEYLNDYISEPNEEFVKCAFSSMVCGAPTRAFVRHARRPAVYFGCDRCIQGGLYYNKHDTFSLHKAQKKRQQPISSAQAT